MTPVQVWEDRILCATRGYTAEERRAMAVMAVHVDQSGGNISVWHLAAIMRPHRCNCFCCNSAAEQLG